MNQPNVTSAETIAAELADLENIVSTLLGSKTHSEEALIDEIAKYRAVTGPHLSDSDCNQLTRKLIRRLNIDVEQGVAVFDQDFKPWLDDKRHELTWDRWLTYKQWLLTVKRPWRVVDKMDLLTQELLDFAGDPSLAGPWARRGLVIGDVQSGKTSTYLGLLNKAADAGYRLVIVLAGNTESLRQQTQARIDEGFIGRDSRLKVARAGSGPSSERFIGVGAIRKDLAKASGMTTVMRDFRKSSQEATNITVTLDQPQPYVFVLKKNKSVLQALTDWLSEQPLTAGQLDIPLLLLDDESDYASVNTREDTNPTAINSAIRDILKMFSRSSYVGFTATPFANIFIDHETDNDLFPRDFIYSLESPNNYVGSEAIFGTTDHANSSAVLDLDDAEESFPIGHKSSYEVSAIPDSLRAALRTFLIANAIRDVRGHDEPRSMLINVSRYKKVQARVYELVEEELSGLRNSIQLHSVNYSNGVPNVDVDLLRSTFREMYADVGVSWEEVLDALPGAVTDIRAQLFNSDRDKKLEEAGIPWDRPKRLVAVGGDVLSRGLTLEGLITSYFYRNVQASDTLLQMARWFGYRDGYEDLCRLWIDPAVAADYRFVASSIDDLRRDLRLMHSQKLTPEHFGLAVRKHPGSLLVTAKNKMKATETRHQRISLLAKRIETTKLSKDHAIIDGNYRALERLIDTLEETRVTRTRTRRGYHRWQHSPKSIVSDFLGSFRAHHTDEVFSQSAISSFVSHTQSPLMQTWDVVLVNGERTTPDGQSAETTLGGITFYPPSRGMTVGSGGELRVSGSSSRLAGSDDLRNLVDEATADRVTQEFKLKFPGKAVPEHDFYAHLARPTLLIYALKPKTTPEGKKRIELDTTSLVVAIKLAIPGDPIDVYNTSTDVEYVINTVAQRLWFVEYADDASDEDIDD
ncbi:Z1 domain-containing protein [Leifsonia sp. A12D58]|uniref:Z1 domain-containing protein n=1 Tax=Leifsonia sp. A12D58 TaxID=3397674 RepID=UPI0039E0EE7C